MTFTRPVVQSSDHEEGKRTEYCIKNKMFIAILTCREAKGKQRTNAGTNQS